MRPTTESESNHQHLDKKTTIELLEGINQEDQSVPLAISLVLPQVEVVVDLVHARMNEGGRLFYIGSGTSGRLGIVDASECPPTYGVPHGWVVGIIAGGDQAIRKAVEFAEDDPDQGWKDLQAHKINADDVVIGISASGSAPYVVGALETCKSKGIATAALVCNQNSKMASVAEHAIEVVVGAEYVTGSTRMKAGTAQKLVLNMITTSVMIKLGRVVGNRMVDMQLSNHKLVNRGTRMVVEATGIEEAHARALLLEHGSVRLAIEFYFKNNKFQK